MRVASLSFSRSLIVCFTLCFAVTSCVPPPVACDGDNDCANGEACVDSACRSVGGDEGEGEAGEGEGEEGEGEAGEGEGEGEGEGAVDNCVFDSDTATALVADENLFVGEDVDFVVCEGAVPTLSGGSARVFVKSTGAVTLTMSVTLLVMDSGSSATGQSSELDVFHEADATVDVFGFGSLNVCDAVTLVNDPCP